MAIEYARTFTHADWIDNEDVVQAEGENGFNVRFHALEDELDAVSAAIGTIGEELEKRFTVEPVAIFSKQLTPDQVTDPEDVETYSNADFPDGVRKLYQVVVEPFGTSHGQVSPHFVYSPAPDDHTRVQIWFKNERSEMARITARVFALA